MSYLNKTLWRKVIDLYKGSLIPLRLVNKTFKENVDDKIRKQNGTLHLPGNWIAELVINHIKRSPIHGGSKRHNKILYATEYMCIMFDMDDKSILIKNKSGPYKTLKIKNGDSLEIQKDPESEKYIGLLTEKDRQIAGFYDLTLQAFSGQVTIFHKDYVYQGFTENTEPKPGRIIFVNGYTWEGMWVCFEPLGNDMMTDETTELIASGKCILESKEMVQGSLNYYCKVCRMNFCESCLKYSICDHLQESWIAGEPLCGLIA